MRVVFAGTPEFAARALRALLHAGPDHGLHVVAAYTQPDRPAGRGMKLTASAVKEVALAHHLPVLQPATLRTPEAAAELAALQPDVMVVAAYGLILPQAILDVPRLGCLNIHASLLPRWRGAAPIHRAILAGDAKTGVAIMQMEAGLDTGPVLLEQRTPIGPGETGGRLHDRLAELGAQTLADGLGLLRVGLRPAAKPQPEAGATYARKLDKGEARLDWTRPAIELERKVRAFNPWPMAEAVLGGERLRIHGAVAIEAAHAAAPGSVLAAGRDGIDVACGEGALRIRVLQREGGKAITAADYLNARRDLIA